MNKYTSLFSSAKQWFIDQLSQLPADVYNKNTRNPNLIGFQFKKTINSTRLSQKFCNILVRWSTIVSDIWYIAWHSPSTTRRDCLYDLEHGLGISVHRLTLPCLIVDVIVTLAKFLRLSGNCITPSTFLNIMVQFVLVNQKFLN